MVYGISGRLSSTFTAQFLGDWANNEGSFIENFQFSTGKNQIRKWNLIIDSNGKIIGTADDIIGKAVGQQYGSAVMLSYKLKLSEDLGGHVIKVIDWMHLLENLLACFLITGIRARYDPAGGLGRALFSAVCLPSCAVRAPSAGSCT